MENSYSLAPDQLQKVQEQANQMSEQIAKMDPLSDEFKETMEFINSLSNETISKQTERNESRLKRSVSSLSSLISSRVSRSLSQLNLEDLENKETIEFTKKTLAELSYNATLTSSLKDALEKKAIELDKTRPEHAKTLREEAILPTLKKHEDIVTSQTIAILDNATVTLVNKYNEDRSIRLDITIQRSIIDKLINKNQEALQQSLERLDRATR